MILMHSTFTLLHFSTVKFWFWQVIKTLYLVWWLLLLLEWQCCCGSFAATDDNDNAALCVLCYLVGAALFLIFQYPMCMDLLLLVLVLNCHKLFVFVIDKCSLKCKYWYYDWYSRCCISRC